jgi:hypothetical protein
MVADGDVEGYDDILWSGEHPNDDFFGQLAAELAGDTEPATASDDEGLRALSPNDAGIAPGVSADLTSAPTPTSTSTLGWPDHSDEAMVTEGASGSATVATPLATLEACVQVVARGGADRLVRIELVPMHDQNEQHDLLRLTTYDPAGWWEVQELQVLADAPGAKPAVVSARELREALYDLRRFDARDSIQVVLDGNATIGNYLLLTQDPSSVPHVSREYAAVERVDLHNADRHGVVLETQVGRLLVTPELVGCLRRRRATTLELVTIDGSAHLMTPLPTSPGVTTTLVARLHELGADDPPLAEERRNSGSEVTQLVAALSSDTPPEELSRILKVGVGYVRRRAAAHPSLPKDLIYELVKEGTEAMRAAAASNVSIGTRACELAATDPSPLVRAVVAANPSIPQTKLERLVDDASVQVRTHAASNPTCTSELLARLADDPDSSVRCAVATHASVDVEVLKVLARDPDPEVCAAVARNPRCPTELLDELVGIAADSVLGNPQAASALLVAGSVIDEPRLRASVARNPNTPRRRLKRLARDDDVEVLRAVAEHPQTPKAARRRALEKLQQTGLPPSA